MSYNLCNTKMVQYDLVLTYGYILFGIVILFNTFKKLFNTNKADLNFQSNNLNTRMKLYEDHTEHNITTIGDEEPFIIRLKGRNFKKIKTHDKYKYSMELLGKELMKEFHAHTAIVLSDEIVLVFPASYYLFNGRCIKLHSIIASYAASYLTFKIDELCSFYCSIVDFNTKSWEMINYIKLRNHQALSLKITPVFIKRQVVSNTNERMQYKHVKFMLKHIKVDTDFIDFFTAPNYDPENNIVKYIIPMSLDK